MRSGQSIFFIFLFMKLNRVTLQAALISEGKTKLYGKLVNKNITGMRCTCTLEEEEEDYLSSVVMPFVVVECAGF